MLIYNQNKVTGSFSPFTQLVAVQFQLRNNIPHLTFYDLLCVFKESHNTIFFKDKCFIFYRRWTAIYLGYTMDSF